MKTRKRQRSGSVVVEVAVCLPLIVLLVFASVEACTMIYLKQSLTVSACEGSHCFGVA